MRACRNCQSSFSPVRPLQVACSPMCSLRLVRTEKKEAKVQTRTRKAALKTIPDLIKEAQVAFNAYIRARDAGRPCICCGQPLGAGDVGGAFDCGHYRSTGSAPHLRFHEDNAHAQRKYCNRHGAGRAVDYRIGLVNRIGLDAVEALESSNAVHKWTREELIEIRKTYAAKAKQLKKESA
jgi:hypothetical protein